MKKKLALLLAASMVVSMIPVSSAFAATANRITNVATGAKDKYLGLTGKDGKANGNQPHLIIEDNKGDLGGSQVHTFQVNLENAEWAFPNYDQDLSNELAPGEGGPGWGLISSGDSSHVNSTYSSQQVIYKKISDSSYLFKAIAVGDEGIDIPMFTKLTDKGEAIVKVDGSSFNSKVSNGTYTFATVESSGTKSTIEKSIDISDSKEKIKAITITEVSPGALKGDPGVTGDAAKGRITLSLSSGFKFVDQSGSSSFQDHYSGTAEVITTDMELANAHMMSASGIEKGGTRSQKVNLYMNKDSDELYFYVDTPNTTNSTVAKILLNDIQVEVDDADVNDIAEITITGTNVSKQTLEVAKYIDYGYTLKADDNEKTPTMYSGTVDGVANTDNETLEVTFKETVANSWWAKRKTTFALPEGVKIIQAEITSTSKLDKDAMEKDNNNKSIAIEETFDQGYSSNYVKVDGNEFELSNFITQANEKAEIKMKFWVSIDPEFEGDLEVTAKGPGVAEEVSCVAAKVIRPFTVEADKNDVIIDYRNVAATDIILTEAEAGVLKKGRQIKLKVDNMKFEKGITLEVVEGDIKFEDPEINTKDGFVILEVKSESHKSAGKIKLSNIQLFLDRSLPAGNYPLLATIVGETSGDGKEGNKNDYIAENKEGYFYSYGDKDKGYRFDTDEVTMIDEYIRVVTAGRDQDDSTFTTKLTITIGAATMTAGEKTINLDVPAYIKDGYTMLPVRAITEALSGVATVRWDDPTKTCLIGFGNRIISMSVGKNTMNINGVETAISASPEIKDERIFLPLRDLGYALGLNDSKIGWDDSTKTATLN